MSDVSRYTLKTAEVQLHTGVKIVAEVGSLDAVKDFIEDVEASKIGQVVKEPVQSTKTSPAPSVPEDPLARMETRAGLSAGSLAKTRLLAIKDGIPQLLRPTTFGNITDAVLVLMFAVETGLRRNPIDYNSFSALYDAQNLKTGSPLSMMLTNLRNQGYLDKRVYADGRNLRLTGKGEQKAIDVLKGLSEAA